MTRILDEMAGDVAVSLHLMNALEDNFIYALMWDKKILVIDPSEAAPVLHMVESEQLDLATILITHSHQDHIGGLSELKKKYNPYVIASDLNLIEGVDQFVGDKEELLTGPFQIVTMSTPGHCLDHISYYFKNIGILFCGDTLFGGGCGRLVQGSAKEQFTSLEQIAKLPVETRLCFGHEYTLKNLEFAISVGGGNEATEERLKDTRDKRAQGHATTPSLLEIELKTNPFLRTSDPAIRAHLKMEAASDFEVFTELRAMRDRF